MTGLTLNEAVDGVVVAVLDRPGQNLFTNEICHQLVAFLHSPPDDAHVLHLRAAGDAFCLGRERGAATPAQMRSEVQALVDVTRALRHTRLVVVTEVQGDAAGFGVGVIAASDVAVAVSGAQFSFPEIGIGLAPALVLAWLPRLVGTREAFWLTATGEQISAERAHELGLLNAVVEDADALHRDVQDRIVALRSRKARVHADIKDMLRTFDGLDGDRVLDLSIDRLVVGSQRRAED
jgi:methylglutaconyl-CoA hydratase